MTSPSILPRLPALLRKWRWALAAWIGCQASLTAQIPFAPPNDLFAQRIILPSEETVRVTQEVFTASAEWGEPFPSSELSLWWQWTAPRDGWWEIVADPPDPEAPLFASAAIFTGEKIDRLVAADDGGMAPATPGHRQLFQARAGVAYHIATQSSGGGSHFGDATDVAFTLQPAEVMANISPTSPRVLARENSAYESWAAGGWSHGPEREPWAADATRSPLYAPLWWEWTAPREGRVLVEIISDSPNGHLGHRVYRGSEPDAARLIPHGDAYFGASVSGQVAAGEKLLVCSGAIYRQQAIARHRVRIQYEPESIPEYVPPTSLEGWPAAVGPFGQHPMFYGAEFYWHCLSTGWVEFDGEGLIPKLVSISLDAIPSEVSPAIPHEGRHYFWVNAGAHRLTLRAPPRTEGYTFSLRKAALAPPANDTVAQAIDLGGGPQAQTRVRPLGATRSLGDPAVPPGERPRPTVWCRWTAPASGPVSLFGGSWHDQVQVFRGSDPITWSEIPTALRQADRLNGARRDFAASMGATYHFCLRGFGNDYDFRLLAGPPLAEEPGQSARVAVLPAGPIAQAMTEGVFAASLTTAWFKTTPAADGWLFFTTDAEQAEAWSGTAFGQRQKVEDTGHYNLPYSGFFRVRAGMSYWFACSNSADGPDGKNISLRLLFDEAPASAGAPTDAIDLGAAKGIAATIHLARRESEENAAWLRWQAPAGVEAVHLHSHAESIRMFESGAAGPEVSPLFGYTHFPVTAGQTYFLKVGKQFPYQPAEFLQLGTRFLRGASNDAFAQASVLEGSSAHDSMPAENTEALIINTLSAELSEPSIKPSQPALPSAWWRWQAPESGLFTAACLSSQPHHREGVYNYYVREFAAAVYQGSSLATLQRVAGVISSHRNGSYYAAPPGHRFAFWAVAGEPYFIQAATPDSMGGLSVSIQHADSYEKWAYHSPGLDLAQAGPDDNPSGDGLTNLLKFTFGLQPALHVNDDPNADRAPQFSLAPDGKAWEARFWSEHFDRGVYLTPEGHLIRGHCATAQLIAETSSDLMNWIKLNEGELLGGNQWRLSFPVDPAQPKKYLRLRARWCPYMPPQ